MNRLQALKASILAGDAIKDADVDVIRRVLYADGRIDRGEVEFLIELRNDVYSVCPAFERLFFPALKDNVL